MRFMTGWRTAFRVKSFKAAVIKAWMLMETTHYTHASASYQAIKAISFM